MPANDKCLYLIHQFLTTQNIIISNLFWILTSTSIGCVGKHYFSIANNLTVQSGTYHKMCLLLASHLSHNPSPNHLWTKIQAWHDWPQCQHCNSTTHCLANHFRQASSPLAAIPIMPVPHARPLALTSHPAPSHPNNTACTANPSHTKLPPKPAAANPTTASPTSHSNHHCKSNHSLTTHRNRSVSSSTIAIAATLWALPMTPATPIALMLVQTLQSFTTSKHCHKSNQPLHKHLPEVPAAQHSPALQPPANQSQPIIIIKSKQTTASLTSQPMQKSNHYQEDVTSPSNQPWSSTVQGSSTATLMVIHLMAVVVGAGAGAGAGLWLHAAACS